MDRPTFEHSRKALAEYDAGLNDRFERLTNAKTFAIGEAVCDEERAARTKLAEALYQDTKDRNRRADCDLVHPNTIRAWVASLPTP